MVTDDPGLVRLDQRIVFDTFKRMVSADMCLVCLDNASFGDGWAFLSAHIGDTVVLARKSTNHRLQSLLFSVVPAKHGHGKKTVGFTREE